MFNIVTNLLAVTGAGLAVGTVTTNWLWGTVSGAVMFILILIVPVEQYHQGLGKLLKPWTALTKFGLVIRLLGLAMVVALLFLN